MDPDLDRDRQEGIGRGIERFMGLSGKVKRQDVLIMSPSLCRSIRLISDSQVFSDKRVTSINTSWMPLVLPST